MSKNIGKIIRANSLPSKGERLTNVIYQVAVPGTATYIDYAVDENGDIKTPTLDKSLLENDFGKVKTVNKQEPDEKGNIDLNDYVQIYNSDEELQEIWNNGIRDKIYFNHQTKDMAIGNSDGDGYSLFKMDEYLDKPIDETADEDKRVVLYSEKEDKSYYIPLSKIAGNIKTVNGIEPDVDGDIQLNLNYIPLTGTEVGKPLTGTIKSKGSQPIIEVEGAVGEFKAGFKQDWDTKFAMYASMYEYRLFEISVTDSDANISAFNTSSGNYVGGRIRLAEETISLKYQNPNNNYLSEFRVDSSGSSLNVFSDTVFNSFYIGSDENKIILSTKSKDNTDFGGLIIEDGKTKAIIGDGDVPFIAEEDNDVLTVAGLNHNLSNYNEDVTLNNQLYYNGVRNADGDLPFKALGISVGTNEVCIIPNTTVPQEFIKSGDGWSLKYKQDNPTFYGAIGAKSIDLSYATAPSITDIPYGAVGSYSFVGGYHNGATGGASVVLGMVNKSQGQTNHIISYRSQIIENRGTANKGKYSNGIYGGELLTIENNISSFIAGGNSNKIIGFGDPKHINRYSQHNAIVGGSNNIVEASNDSIAQGNVIVGGNNNKAQGLYQFVSGVRNEAVTYGETLLGIYGTIQNKSLSGRDYISNARIFNIGVGVWYGENSEDFIRKDGLSVFWDGLVTAPQLTTQLIDSSAKSLITKEYIDIRIPKPPIEGSFVLKSVNGVVSWLID